MSSPSREDSFDEINEATISEHCDVHPMPRQKSVKRFPSRSFTLPIQLQQIIPKIMIVDDAPLNRMVLAKII
jgi:hypothetical protein